MQRKGMDHQIMGCGLQRKRVIIGDCREIRPKAGKTCHHHWGRKGSVNLLKSFLNFGHDLFVQKEGRGPGAVQGQSTAICQKRGGRVHGGAR
jgi:hypothetical protein